MVIDQDLRFYVGIIGFIPSIFIFFSPAEVFWRIVKKRCTEEFESIPYISALLCSSLWCYYGFTKPGELKVFTINAIGVVVESIYVFIFLIFAPPKIKRKTAGLVGFLNIGFVVAVVLVTKLVFQGAALINAIGYLCVGLNIIMYASPLAAMRTVMRTNSVEFMPFYLSLFIFLNGSVWTLYAFLDHDWFLGVPNGMGFIFGAAELILYAIYSKLEKEAKHPTTVFEDYTQNEPLIPPSNHYGVVVQV
ncbi:unnamed protein product [Cuscuta epithymum]|uniref:Bidirectional sugar transporter SWEET n=1 Tax=Cuscuta epithymum TaxID=186058 RepID=A0AAV0C6Q3_9ASTE|nr:unnamed protein product [Cuscuta epithymum]